MRFGCQIAADRHAGHAKKRGSIIEMQRPNLCQLSPEALNALGFLHGTSPVWSCLP
jgi:hypothetical protein